MLLQSHRSFDLVAEFDTVTGTLEEFSKSCHLERVDSKRNGGVFDYLGVHRILLFRIGTDLLVQVDGHLLNCADLSIETLKTPHGRRLSFRSEGVLKISIEYSVSSDLSSHDDLTAFADAEDFDFGLFLANVSLDRLRQDRLFQY